MPTETEELISSLESRFGIELPSEDLRSVHTPEDLIDLILDRVQHRDGQCQNPRCFNLIRRELVDSFGMIREDVSIGTYLGVHVPRDQRQRLLDTLAGLAQMTSTPSLRLSEPVQRLVFYLVSIAGLVAFIAISLSIQLGEHLLAGSLAVLVVGVFIVGNRLLDRYRTELPYGLSTVEAWVAQLALSQPSGSPKQSWSKGEVRDAVRATVTAVLGIEEFHYSARFVEDLSID